MDVGCIIKLNLSLSGRLKAKGATKLKDCIMLCVSGDPANFAKHPKFSFSAIQYGYSLEAHILHYSGTTYPIYEN